MGTADTYIAPGSIDVATLVVGMVFLAFFIAAASVLARHHLGMLTAVVGAGMWLFSTLVLANERGLAAYLGPMAGGSAGAIRFDIVRSVQHASPWIAALGVVIAVSAFVFHRVEDEATPTFEPLEDQNDSPHHPDVGGHALS